MRQMTRNRSLLIKKSIMKSLFKRCLVLLFTFICTHQPLSAQFSNIYELTPVCNNDGVLVIGTLFPGLGVYYTWYTNSWVVTHFSSDLYDTLFNFTGGFVHLSMLPNNGIPAIDQYDYFDF